MQTSQLLIQQILQETQKVIVGKETQIKLSLAAFISGSHLLIEDIPGVGKTTLAKTLSHCLGLEYSRVQFTNDLLPSDVIGVNFYNVKEASFSFKRGPIFSQFMLADEINRASSKTQSALLEAMEEKHVSVDGVTYELPQPFFVCATKNPFEEVGTYELPSSQLDRFAISISLGYPTKDAEREILSAKKSINSQS
ncbi:MAG: AAA family ATPase [Sulfurimonas sp.]|nr:AAA family ATPase [Sulfurimonas sp.]